MKLTVAQPEFTLGYEVTLMENTIQAGFYARVKGDSMIDADMDEGDILIIDKSLEPTNGKIAVCMVDGEFTVKKIKVDKDCLWLIPYNKRFKPIRITEDNDFLVWGIVTYIIKQV